jgi:hypothetical protein
MPIPKFLITLNSNAEETFFQSAGSQKNIHIKMKDGKKRYTVKTNKNGHKYIQKNGNHVLLKSIKGQYVYC